MVVELTSPGADTTSVGRDVALRRDERGFFVLAAAVVTTIAQLTDPGTALDLLIVSPAVVAFVFQDRLARFPEVFALLVVGPIFVVVGVRTVLEPMLFLSVLMVLYVSAHVESTVRAALIAAFAAASPWVIGEFLAVEEDIGSQSWVMAHLFTFLIGRVVHRQQTLIVQLEQARQALAEQAVAEERRRIARELHDLAGHTLAAMLLHVTGARHVLRRDLDDAERALVDAESVGRASLDQIRATVAALRTDERGTDPALVRFCRSRSLSSTSTAAPGSRSRQRSHPESPSSPARPAPPCIASHARRSPMSLGTHPATRSRSSPPSIDGDVLLTVADHGRAAAAPDPNSGHFGLVGMSERARALGGSLDAGTTADGWRVDARLPILAAPSNEFVPS